MLEVEPALEWFRRQGHRVISSPSSFWYDVSPRVLQAFPYHLTIDPSEDELRGVLKDGKAFGLRYSAPLTASVGKISYHVVYSKPVYGLDQVSRQTRQNIRKGLDYANVEPVSFARLAQEGWALRAETVARQGRFEAENEAWWKRLCLSAEGLPGFEAWGAIHKGQLVASLIVYLAGDCYLMLYQQSLTAHLRFGINNALAFVFTQRALARPGVKKLFYGLESLDADWQVDEFKLRMGYAAEPVRQRVLFHPVLRPLIHRASLAILDHRGNKVFRGAKWAKFAGMMRFYLEGNCPLSQQKWPPFLIQRSEELLKSAGALVCERQPNI